jgi:endonuclease/exonuclease/phosphatase (EEP) superfamily protein YafD
VKRFLRAAVTGLAVLYPAALAGLTAALRFVGERWWVTSVALYLPRAVFLAPLPILAIALPLLRAGRVPYIALGASLPVGLVLMGFVPPWPSRPAAVPSLRILSFNVNAEQAGVDEVLAEIDGYAPEILLMQEVVPYDHLEDKLRARFPYVKLAGQFAIASKFPLDGFVEPQPLTYLGHPRSPRWTRQVVATPLGPIAFYNVHPISPREGFNALRGDGLRQEILSGKGFPENSNEVVQKNGGLRAAQVASFAEAAGGEAVPVVIAGDTNLPGLSPVLAHLSTYQDGFAEAGWGFGYTFPTGHRGPWMRIDRILASEPLRFVTFQVGRSHVSDHDCVVANLQRR